MTILFDKIREAFPPENMPDVPMIDCIYGIEEAEEATEVFRGKRWDELSAKDFAFPACEIYFLAYAWQWYYLPALMWRSVEELDAYGELMDTAHAVEAIVEMIDSYTYPENEAESQIRKYLSVSQVKILQDWIYFLLAHSDEMPRIAEHLMPILENYVKKQDVKLKQ